jgi:hypothetical protein
MGFVTESQMRTDYKYLFHKDVQNTQYKLVGWLTPEGILIELIEETMDSQSINEEVIASKLIDRRKR